MVIRINFIPHFYQLFMGEIPRRLYKYLRKKLVCLLYVILFTTVQLQKNTELLRKNYREIWKKNRRNSGEKFSPRLLS